MPPLFRRAAALATASRHFRTMPTYKKDDRPSRPEDLGNIPRLTAANVLVVYGEDYCPYCRKAFEIVGGSGLGGKVVGADGRADAAVADGMDVRTSFVYRKEMSVEERAELQKFARDDFRIPQASLGGVYLGGYEELEEMLKTGALKTALGKDRAAVETLVAPTMAKKK